MRKLAILAVAFLTAASPCFLSAQEGAPPSRVVAVTVYADRALVTRRVEASLPKGESTLVLSGLPAATDPESVQVSGVGAFTLRDVRVAFRQTSRDVSAQLLALENEKRVLEDRLAAVNDRAKEALAEQAFLADMAKRLTTHAGDSEVLPLDPVAWAKMLDFHRSRNALVDETIRTSKREAQGYQTEIDRVNREIRALGQGSGLSVVEATLVVDSPAPGKAVIDLSYLVAGPSWRADYVLRADSGSDKLSVQYRALVRQNTGESWEAAAVSLSTARPQAGGALPELIPWYLDVYSPPPVAWKRAQESAAFAKGAPAPMEAMDMNAEKPEMELATAQASTGATAVTFDLPGSTTIASDNRDHTVTIAMLKLPVSYSWAAVPKLSPYAYYRSEAKNDSEFPFLAGSTHIYVDGSYIADASLTSVPSGGSFRTDLGVDEAVRVERVLARKFDESTGALSKKSKTTWEYEIRVKNGKKRDITLTVSDQLPISRNELIVVKPLAPAYSKDTAALRKADNETFEWTLSLPPGKEAALPLAFSVEYPKGTPVTGLE